MYVIVMIIASLASNISPNRSVLAPVPIVIEHLPRQKHGLLSFVPEAMPNSNAFGGPKLKSDPFGGPIPKLNPFGSETSATSGDSGMLSTHELAY